MRFHRLSFFAIAAFAFAGMLPVQSAAQEAEDNKPAVEAIPAAEQEAMDAECAFITALIDANMPDLAAPVIAKAREKWPVLSARLEVLEQQGHLRLGHFDEVNAVLAKKAKGSPEYWALSIAMANAYYARQKLPECRKLYGEFFKGVPVPTKELMSFYQEAAYTWIQILRSEKKFDQSIAVYDGLLKLPLKDDVWAVFATEETELCLQLAAETKDPKKRASYLKKASMRADRMLWMSDLLLVYGRAVSLKAHVEMAQGNIARAQELVNEYLPQLQDIHNQLLQLDPDGSQGLIRQSPMPSCRYLLAEMLWKEVEKEVESKKPNKAKVADLLFGVKEGGKRNGAGAFNHAINVFVKYPESSWAASAGELAEEIKKLVKSMFNKDVKTNITAAQIDHVRKMQFKAANASYREARWSDAVKAYKEVLSQYPETENSLDAVFKLAESAFEVWKAERNAKEKAALRCDVDAIEGYYAERFSGVNPKWTRTAGDNVLRLAGREMINGSRAQSQKLYDTYFKLYPTHYQAAQMAMSLGGAAYKAEDYNQAIHYFNTVLDQYSNSTYRVQALQMMSACFGKQGDVVGQIEYLKKYLEASKMVMDRVNARLSLAVLERNRGFELYDAAATNTVEDAKAATMKMASDSILSAVKSFRALVKDAAAGIESPLMSSGDKKKLSLSREQALFLEGDTWQRLQHPIGKFDISAFLKQAAKCYESYMEAAPKGKYAPQTLVMLGTVYTAMGDAAKSKDTFARLAKEFPESEEAKNSVPFFAKALMSMGRKGEAVEQYEQMLRTSGNYTPKQFLDAGDALVNFKAYDTAQMLYQKVADIAKGKPNAAIYEARAQLGEAKALNGAGRITEAHEALDRFIEKNARSAIVVDAYLMLIEIASEEGRRERDNNLRRKFFNAAIGAVKKVRQFRPEMEDELSLESAGVLVRKMEAEETMQLKDEALETLRLAVGGYQAFLVAHEPTEEHPVSKMTPKQLKNLERCYASVLPLMAKLIPHVTDDKKEFAARVVKYGESYLDIYPNGKSKTAVQNAINQAKAEL
ncbi:MAG: tetratricopeptide repeat protein [Kiritimatiellae bacterium]|nr:tetratricopeptide repeat protein [Kiritimatiellia bacterium]